MRQIFVVTTVIDAPREISANTIKEDLEKALDDSTLWNVKIDVTKPRNVN